MHKKTIKILSFNLALLDIRLFGLTLVKPAKYMQERLAIMPEKILEMNADILAFQEVYSKEHQSFLIESLKKVYPFYSRSELFGFRMNGGLMTFSKFPITQSKYIPFIWNTLDEMIVVQRGFLTESIEIEGFGSLGLVNTHMTAGGAFFDQDAKEIQYLRKLQMKQIYRNTIKRKNLTIISGDFNCGPNISEENYRFLLNKGYYDSFIFSNEDIELQYTWDTDIYLNKHGYFKNSIKQRVDHIFLPDFSVKNIEVLSSKIIFDKPVLQIDKNDVHLSDHFGIMTELRIK